MSGQRYTVPGISMNDPRYNSFTNIPPPPIPPRFSLPNVPPPPFPPQPSFLPPNFTHSPHSGQPVGIEANSLHAAHSWNKKVIPPAFNQECVLKKVSIQETENSQKFVDCWVKSRGIVSSTSSNRPVAKKDLKIYVVKEKLNDAFRLIRELENGTRTLGVMAKTVSVSEWNEKCQEIEEKKKELVVLLNELKLSEEEFNTFREKCSKRSKKRARLKRQSCKLKKQKEDDKIKIQNLHFQIDNWQKEMQEGVERVQREEELQREADAVLWSVTQKKSEAKRQVALLSALLTLRTVRVARLTSAGQPVSQSQIDTFNTVIERLKKMWSKHLEEYLLEEQALRGMLSEAIIKEDPVKTHKKLVLNEWEIALFGSVGTLDSTVKGNDLIDIRRAWDRFAFLDQSMLATSIPSGWVLPTPPCSEEWSKLLKQY